MTGKQVTANAIVLSIFLFPHVLVWSVWHKEILKILRSGVGNALSFTFIYLLVAIIILLISAIFSDSIYKYKAFRD